MKKVHYNISGKTLQLNESANLVAVRTHKSQTLQKALTSKASKDLSQKLKVKQKMPRANVIVLQVKEENKKTQIKIRNEARKTFKKEKDIRFAGRVLVDPVSEQPVLYTENIYVRFHDTIPQVECRKIISLFKLAIKTIIPYETNAFFVQAKEGTGMKIFEICRKLLARKEVKTCEPELIRKKGKKTFLLPNPPKIHIRQWHLKKTVYRKKTISAHGQVEKAHSISKGENITIAVIDDGVDIRHPEFKLTGKIHAPLNVDDKSDDPMPFYHDDDHGTACAGVACASGQYKACGVAPAARLMPVRNESDLGSFDEAFAISYAADNGADIISCSWGPEDGDPDDPDDPLHLQSYELPERTKRAIHYAVTKGRGGKGCVVLFSAGNGNENADLDGYISNPDIIAVAACNDRNRRSIFSDYGKCIWVCFPSNDWEGEDHPAPVTPGIWTTDRLKKRGYSPTGYANDFGGTSSACPGVAGVCALMLSVNPDLTAKQVKEILKTTADKIDKKNKDKKGKYDAMGHSQWYGYGRVNAFKAVKLAKKMKQ